MYESVSENINMSFANFELKSEAEAAAALNHLLKQASRQKAASLEQSYFTAKQHWQVIEELFPGEVHLETGRLVKILIEETQGINKENLCRKFYLHYDTFSFQRQLSLQTCLNKLLQRSRKKFRNFGIRIAFCPKQKLWFALPELHRKDVRDF